MDTRYYKLCIVGESNAGKSSIADYMIIASGTSSRHIQSLSEQVLEKLKDSGVKNSKIEGTESNELLISGDNLEEIIKKKILLTIYLKII